MLFDPATVDRGPKRRVNDLPGGHPRLTTGPVGLHGVWVSGVPVDEEQGRQPGRLLRATNKP